MAHLLTPATTTAATALTTRPRKSSYLYSWKNGRFQTPKVCCVGHQIQHHQISDQDKVLPPHDDHSLRRRALVGLSGAVVLGLGWGDGQSAMGAGKRPPPPPPKEKKDPNLSGVQAKVLASKKRKEALKESVAKLREKGKPLNKEPPPAPPPAPVEAPPPAPEEAPPPAPEASSPPAPEE